MIHILVYRICPNRGPGLYFFPGNFDPASIRARLLLKYMEILSVTSVVSNTKSVFFSVVYARASRWLLVEIRTRLVLS